MTIKLTNTNGVDVTYQNVPDCWHAYQWLKDNGNPAMGSGETLADMVLECWHQAHDYRNVITEHATLISK